MESAQVVRYDGEPIGTEQQITKFLQRIKNPKARYGVQCEMRNVLFVTAEAWT